MTTWKTCDLQTIQFLLYKGHEAVDSKVDGSRVFILFSDDGSIGQEVKDFRGRKVMVEPMLYNECRRRAMNMIENAKMESGGN